MPAMLDQSADLLQQWWLYDAAATECSTHLTQDNLLRIPSEACCDGCPFCQGKFDSQHVFIAVYMIWLGNGRSVQRSPSVATVKNKQ